MSEDSCEQRFDDYKQKVEEKLLIQSLKEHIVYLEYSLRRKDNIIADNKETIAEKDKCIEEYIKRIEFLEEKIFILESPL